MSLTDPARRTPSRQVPGWRIATAVRVFTLAIALGQMLSSQLVSSLGVLFIGLVIIALVASVLDIDAPGLMGRLIPIFEGILAAALLFTTTGDVDPLVIYLAAPIMIGGVRGGWVGCLNAGLGIVLTAIAVWLTPESFTQAAQSTRAALPWMVVGLGAGLLAAMQTPVDPADGGGPGAVSGGPPDHDPICMPSPRIWAAGWTPRPSPPPCCEKS
ncbi:MAG: hypothetical protein V9F00_02615 [Nocardioides sp.]